MLLGWRSGRWKLATLAYQNEFPLLRWPALPFTRLYLSTSPARECVCMCVGVVPWVCLCACMRVLTCVCAWEREKEGEKERNRTREWRAFPVYHHFTVCSKLSLSLLLSLDSVCRTLFPLSLSPSLDPLPHPTPTLTPVSRCGVVRRWCKQKLKQSAPDIISSHRFAPAGPTRSQWDFVSDFAENLNESKMSWGEYLSNLQRDGLKHAAICGLDGASWIQVTDGSNVSSFFFQQDPAGFELRPSRLKVMFRSCFASLLTENCL